MCVCMKSHRECVPVFICAYALCLHAHSVCLSVVVGMLHAYNRAHAFQPLLSNVGSEQTAVSENCGRFLCTLTGRRMWSACQQLHPALGLHVQFS